MGLLAKKHMAILVASVMVCGTALARDFRSADVHPQDYPTVQAVNYIGKRIHEKTDGKYKVKVFGNSTLGSEKDTLEQVKIGALDMVRVNSSAFHGIVPESVISSFPFIFRDMEHFRKTMYGSIGDEILASMEKVGYIGLCMYESGARSMYGKKPIRNLADIKGMKIRVPQSELFVSMVTALGASPTPVPYAEVYTGLKTGLVDAAENNYPSYETAKHYEAADIYSETQHMIAPEVVVFSKKVWDTLSKEEQKVIREAAKESVPFYVALWTEKEKSAKAALVKNGVKFIEDVDKQQFVDAEQEVWNKYANTPALKDLVKRIVETR